VVNVFARDKGSAAVPPLNQPPAHQQIERLADGHSRHAELLRQRLFAGQRAADVVVRRIQPQPQSVSNRFVDHQ